MASPSPSLEKGVVEKGYAVQHLETLSPQVTAESQFRTHGDGQDHDHEPPLTFKRFMSFAAMAFLWTASQIPVYLFGGAPPYIYGDIGGADRWIWFVLANLLSLAAVCPFVGSLSDILGRRYVALLGAALTMLGMVICSTAQTMNIFISGMVFAGVGAGINELTALAVTSEMAPTSKRGLYVSILVFTIIPFCPSIMYAQLIASTVGWRYLGLVCGVWTFIGFALTLIFYHPPPRVNSLGLTRMETVRRIDFMGGLLSISGMILFMAGCQWGGYQYPWTSAHVLVPLLLGVFLLFCFGMWEWKFAKYPMFPKRLVRAPRVFYLTMVITAISGANFFSILFFYPTQIYNMYGHDPVQVGLRGLPLGFSILTGACLCLFLLSALRGHNRSLLTVACIFMTAGCGGLAVANLDNMTTVYGVLTIGCLGIGGIVVPASIITTIICPDDLIATVSALTLAIRVIGGSIGYCIYYNIFFNKFVGEATTLIGGTMVKYLNITNKAVITEAIELTGASLLPALKELPGIAGNETAYEMVVYAGQLAYSNSYSYVYLVSIAFGVISIVCSLCLGDIGQYMDDHVAVVL